MVEKIESPIRVSLKFKLRIRISKYNFTLLVNKNKGYETNVRLYTEQIFLTRHK